MAHTTTTTTNNNNTCNTNICLYCFWETFTYIEKVADITKPQEGDRNCQRWEMFRMNNLDDKETSTLFLSQDQEEI